MINLPEQAASGSGRDYLMGGGEMGTRIRAFDWSQTPLGPIDSWPQSLRTAVSLMLNSRYPMFVWWGKELTKLYNDAYIPALGARHPHALGQSAPNVWKEIWDVVGPQAEVVFNEGRSTWNEDLLLVMERYGYTEETYFTFSYSPAPDDDGSVGGVFCACTEETGKVIGARRLRTLREIAQKTADARTAEEACSLSAQAIGSNAYELPFALIYLKDSSGKRAYLAGNAGIEPGATACPLEIDIPQTEATLDQWPLFAAERSESGLLIDDLETRFGALSGGHWPEATHSALILSLSQPGQKESTGFLIAGISPRRLFDDDYRGFLNLVAGQVSTCIASARSYEAERKRAESLAELDRAKTTFFSNISHEFRTPLTLMLGPLEQSLAGAYGPLSPDQHREVERVHRNGVRLLKMVNTMLDFSRIEADRIQAIFEPVDLAQLTGELASIFRSAVERAGIRLVVDCTPLPEPLFVDREMWEKIVLNLISNAFKFTFDGVIAVTLRWAVDHIELEVRDTGTGIPEQELPRIFERFHSVRSGRARSHEGTGIGLALVQELTRLHGGNVRVASEINKGSVFTVTIPAGSAHLPPERIGVARTMALSQTAAEAFIEEALRWLPEDSALSDQWPEIRSEDSARQNGERLEAHRTRVLLADDNSDMRDYLTRLFGERWVVEAVSDGGSALASARENLPDIVVTDVMMPGMDGFELLRQLRADPHTREVPVLLLSARAGEESRVEGLESGADDYMIKPFSARELMARVGARIEMARMRREAARRERELTGEVREAKDRLQHILASINDNFVMYDHNWRFAYVNDKAAETIGLPKKELIGQCAWDILSESKNSSYYTKLLQASEEHQDITFEHYDPAQHRWFENRVYLLEDGVAVFATDITKRKSAEEALRESEERLRLAIDAGQVGTWDWDMVQNHVTWSDRIYEFHGLEPGTFGERMEDFAALVHADDRERILEAIQSAIRSEQSYKIEMRIVQPDGGLRWISTNGDIIFDSSGKPVRMLGATIDITDRKQAEESLRQSEQLYRAIGESINYGIWVCDSEGHNIYASESFLNLVGLTQQECSEFGWAVSLHPDDIEKTMEAWKICVREGNLWEREHRFRGVDGKWHYILARGLPIRDDEGRIECWAGINLDIESLKRTEQALRESEERFRNMADHAPVMIWMTDQNGICTYLSKSWYELTGQTEETGLGFGWLDAIHSEDRDYVHQTFNAASEGHKSFKVDYRLRRRDDQYRWAIDSATPRFGSQREFLGYIGSVIDITERKQVETERERLLVREQEARELAESTNRLKDEFLATLSHELRTPLNAVIGWTELLARGGADDELQDHGLSVILRNAKAQAQLVEDLLDVSRIITGKFRLDARLVEVIPIVEAAVEAVSLSAETRGIVIRRLFDYSAGAIFADPARLQQIVWNLLSNAVKFTPQGGRVEARVERLDSSIEITVSDTGQGISADFLPHIFDRFRQADSSYTRKHTGLGLGLAIVRHLVELHGGTVEAFSEGEGKGSNFRVSLPVTPLSDQKVIDHTVQQESDSKSVLEGLRILIVDDHADTRDMLSVILEISGAEIRTAGAAAEAFKILKDWKPDVLVSDIGMPDEDGYDLIRKVRGLDSEQGGNTPALALTGYASDQEGDKALSAGYQLHMAKPVEPASLVSAISRLAAEKAQG